MRTKGSDKEKLVSRQPDFALVKAAINGDADSFTELCKRYYAAMVAIAHSVLSDAAQQAFAKAALKLPQLKNKNKFADWLAVICRNVAKDTARDTEKLRTTEDLSVIAAESLGPRLHQDATTGVVREAIAELSASQKEVVFLRFYDGMTYERISAVLGISEQAINGRLRRAKKKIADYLRRNGFAEVRL